MNNKMEEKNLKSFANKRESLLVYERNILKAYFYSFFASIELTLSIFTLFFLARDLSMTQIMVLELIFAIFMFVFEVPSGIFADLYGRKNSMAISMFFAAVAFLIFPLTSSIYIYAIAQILLALSWAMNSGADSAWLYDTLKELKKEDRFNKTFGNYRTIAMITYAFSGLLSIFLAGYYSYEKLFLWTSAIFFLSTLIALSFKEPPVHKELHEKNFLKHAKASFKYAKEHSLVRSLIIYYSVSGALSHLLYFFLQPYYKSSDLPFFVIGIAVTIYFGATSIGNLLSNRLTKNVKPRKFLTRVLLVSSISLIIVGLNPLIGLLTLIIYRVLVGVRGIYIEELINHNIPSSHRASIISVKNMGKSTIYLIAAPLLGIISDTYSFAHSILSMGFALLLFYIFWTITSKKYEGKISD
ncbi:hypothetical protein C0585_03645 [Candidatus Woesearchaeota archaeon]|nr:MAG: hypothetical protein C0585_03645 [Candidatus Woesearchaeota archaeon]